MSPRRLVPVLFTVLLLVVGGWQSARAEVALYYAVGGTAIAGYDPVSYFHDDAPRKGRAEYSLTWKRVVWLFASAENRDAFEADPRAYAPQFGGFCAYAMSRGKKSATNPLAWWIQDGRLYLIHDLNLRDRWMRDIAGNVALAREHWPTVLRN